MPSISLSENCAYCTHSSKCYNRYDTMTAGEERKPTVLYVENKGTN